MLIGVSLMLFISYYLLKDGAGLVDWIIDVSPLPDDVERGLVNETRDTTWAVIKGHVLVAFVQGIVAGIGLAIAGVPNYVFWTFVMIMLGFIPIIGATVVWFPASIYLLVIDRPAAGLFLLLYGFLAVGLTDNFVRPIAVDRGSDLHPAVIIIGVVGGVYTFGAPGLFIGPIMLGAFKSLLNVFSENYETL
jgi:predicted PurR-regulated permease PerM